jgi:methionyl-tRNA synthetase
MDTITFDEFKKVKIKMATVTDAQKVEGSDKLIKLTLDFGEEEKGQVVSGIADFYDPEALVGKQLPFVVNLEPRTLMGVKSRGMLMAADDNGKAILLNPDKHVTPGSEVV